MRTRTTIITLLLVAAGAATAMAHHTRDFYVERCAFKPNGRNLFMNINRGTFHRLEGFEDGAFVEVEITALADKVTVHFTAPDGTPMSVRCRVIEEREWEDGELVEVSRNYFARCTKTSNIFYFGESVDDYEDGEIVGHEGEWLAGVDGAQPGIIMPGTYFHDAKYFQEIAPGVAMDRARNAAQGMTVVTPAGTFTDCIKVVETSSLDPDERSVKYYAPGVGIVYDDGLELVAWSN
jgi:hypothetical protein